MYIDILAKRPEMAKVDHSLRVVDLVKTIAAKFNDFRLLSSRVNLTTVASQPVTVKTSRDSPIPIIPRSYHFRLPANRALDWEVNGPHSSIFFNTMSVFFPLLEQVHINETNH